MQLGLTDLKAVVTGGTRGIGRAIVEELAHEGCRLGLCARHADDVTTLIGALEARGVRATGRAVDVADGERLRAEMTAMANSLGGLDILVANASAFGLEPGPESWRKSFDVDLMGTVHAVEAALPFLERSPAGAVVVVSSIGALETFGGVRPYDAAKAALITYASSLSRTLARKGIRVNTVSPGSIYFPGGLWHTRERESPELFHKTIARNPFGRLGRPDEVAKAVVFLASPAASYIAGANLVVDGAMTSRVQF